ncbi:hypothetical protein VKT23_010779 [Stygiomarasmius scandens]|uniref:CFEM domain-containing protein n=1 Tax=Marasmiellus scandens TaxID=2682957 RepID=A0ABR1JE99_9AGAR
MFALNKLAFLFALVGLVAVNASPDPQAQAQDQTQSQSTTNNPKPLASQPDCVNQCLVDAAPGNGCGDTDLNCMCASSALQDAARQCIQTQCPDSGLKNADTLKSQLCQN